MQLLQKQKKGGFTLAELMAVVVIVAIIAVLGVGSYRSAMEKAIFNEGLSIAHAITAAADEYYYEYHKKPTQLSQLVLDLQGVTISGETFSTKYFNGSFTETSGVQMASKTKPYKIFSYMEYYMNRSDVCQGTNADGVAFCQSMGYANCTTSNSCTK